MTFATTANIPEHAYKINNVEIEKVESVKYLGVHVISKIS